MSDWTYDAVIVDVHDGDTVTLDADLGFGTWHRNMRIRLYGMNAPELDTTAGKEAQVFLRNLLPVGSKVTLISIKDHADKYGGRWLGFVRTGSTGSTGETVNNLMVQSGHAKVWDGKGLKPV